MYLFIVTLVNVLITLLLPVRDRPVLPRKTHLISSVSLRLTSLLLDPGSDPHIFPCELSSYSPLFFRSIEIVLHSNLACRLMIGLREAGQSFTHKTEALELSGLPEHNTAEFAHTGGRTLSGESSWVGLEGCAGPSKV